MGKCTRAMTYCVDNGIRALGPIFIVIALTLIFGVVYVLLYEILPYYTMLSSPLGLMHLSVSAFILFNILFNYSMTILVHPGSTPSLTPEETQQVENVLKTEPSVRRGEGFSRVCKFCKKPKPPRTHHCHICKCCVLRMDHHCPWVSNCVGFNNHKYFVLFLFYLCLGCFYVSVLSFFPFYSLTDYSTPSRYTGSKTAVLFVFVMALSVMLAVGMLLTWHIYLVATAQTTIEFYYNRNKARMARTRGEIYHNEYDLGFVKNWSIFFGEGKFWFMPSQKPPPGDGMVYLTRGEHIKKLGVNHHFV